MPMGSRRTHVGRGLAATVVLVLLAPAEILTAQAPDSVESTFRKMLAAIQSDSYEDFVAPGDAAFKAGMTRQMLEGVSRELAPRLKQGYQAVFLTSLRQQGYVVYLWKLSFKDGRDDYLVKMAVKEGKVGGFWVQ